MVGCTCEIEIRDRDRDRDRGKGKECMPFQEEFLNVRGTKIQLLKGGSGDPLLYLHSAGGEVMWLPFFEQLAQRYMVYLPAHPGFSQSEGLEKIDTMED